MRKITKTYLRIFLFIILISAGTKIYSDLKFVDNLVVSNLNSEIQARTGESLTFSYGISWNDTDILELSEFPEFLVNAVVVIEDHRFYKHYGFDQYAVGGALLDFLQFRGIKRGASTITEQVVKMFGSRKRTFYTKVLELFEAINLEHNFSKKEILTFYLNQVPLPKNTRGFAQAARRIFGRSLSSLNKKEILILISSLAAPGKYREDTRHFDAVKEVLVLNQLIKKDEDLGKIGLVSSDFNFDSRHFVKFVRSQSKLNSAKNKIIKTTLDLSIQQFVEAALTERLTQLSKKRVSNAAALVVENRSHEILAWASKSIDGRGERIDGVLALRQPGSTLKPFLYQLAIQKGWTGATLIDDAPLKRGVSGGIKDFKNYSQTYYGKISLRKALGNSLNTPAVRAIAFVGVENFYHQLHNYGFNSLNKGAYYYGEGLALGDGEVSLYELVRAYAAFANECIFSELTSFLGTELKQAPGFIQQNLKESCFIISDILGDSKARELEFGSLLFETPFFLALKTGTSTDYRDAWAVGFNKKYTIGVWLGNLSGESMQDVSGANGALVVLRTIFSSLDNSNSKIDQPSNVKRVQVCDGECDPKNLVLTELVINNNNETLENPIKEKLIEYPQPDTIFALNPRFDRASQSLEFKSKQNVFWYVDNQQVGLGKTFSWGLTKGEHLIKAVEKDETEELKILVK